MADPLINASSVMLCPHGGQVQLTSPLARVQASGTPVASISSQGVIIGCAFTNPCLTVRFISGTVRAMANGQPLVTATSVGQCLAGNGAANGPVVFTGGDPRVQVS